MDNLLILYLLVNEIALYRLSIYNNYMIRNFKSKLAQGLYNGVMSAHVRKIPPELHEKARRLFDQINAVTNLETLRVPPGNHLEKLKGDLKVYWSVRINIKWRIIFKWENADAIDVDIIDYH